MTRLASLAVLGALLASCSGSGGSSSGSTLPPNDPRTTILQGIRSEPLVGTVVDYDGSPHGLPIRVVVTSASTSGVEFIAQRFDGTTVTDEWRVRTVVEPQLNASLGVLGAEAELQRAGTNQFAQCFVSIGTHHLTFGPVPGADTVSVRQVPVHRARWIGTFQGTVPVWMVDGMSGERPRAFRLEVEDSDGIQVTGTLTMSVDDGHGTPWRPVVVQLGAAIGAGGSLWTSTMLGGRSMRMRIDTTPTDHSTGPAHEVWITTNRLVQMFELERVGQRQ